MPSPISAAMSNLEQRQRIIVAVHSPTLKGDVWTAIMTCLKYSRMGR